jgi:Protein of unknown function (DUF2939)
VDRRRNRPQTSSAAVLDRALRRDAADRRQHRQATGTVAALEAAASSVRSFTASVRRMGWAQTMLCRAAAAIHRMSQAMKQFISAFLLLLILLVGYWVWPFFGLKALGVAVQTGNATALSEQVDFGSLRRSLAEQIIRTYLRITGRASKLGPLNALAPAVGASIVDPWVLQIINSENLVALLRGGTNTAWDAWLSSKYGLGRFSIGWPVDVTATEQFRLRMQLISWRWKLTGIDLPDKLRDQFARELAKKYP